MLTDNCCIFQNVEAWTNLGALYLTNNNIDVSRTPLGDSQLIP